SYQVRKKMIAPKEPEIENAPPAPDAVRHKTYSMFFSMLVLADTHRQNLLGRGFTEQQIEENGYKSTPVFGFKKLTRKLLEAGCTVKGVPGFYQDRDGEWTIHFSNKSSGFLVPVRNMDHMIVGAQIRLDHPYDGRKYIWLSSTNFHMGTSSGSPVHLAGSPGEKTIFITEGPLKGDLAHALSGRTFGCVPGANQYANLPPFLQAMKLMGTEAVYEAYDMDKLLKTVCRGDYNEKCAHCESYRKCREGQELPCEKKNVKRQNIQRGCRKLAEICRELELPIKTLTWDTDEDGDWAEHVKGVDDYLHGLEQKKRNS
ncbi:DNA primase, partial [uncultured Acetatifactor sp.]|uniref:DNA primase n=1 Tax=uncultured Acetatifactor sp. TaxID=1671927 RepID=UPI00261F47CC